MIIVFLERHVARIQNKTLVTKCGPLRIKALQLSGALTTTMSVQGKQTAVKSNIQLSTT